MTTTNQGAQVPTRKHKRPTRLIRVALGTDEQVQKINAMTPDERLAKLTKGEYHVS